jgi:hypothetical protein
MTMRMFLSFRALADAELKKEAKNAAKAKETKKQQPKKGWFSGWFGSKTEDQQVRAIYFNKLIHFTL